MPSSPTDGMYFEFHVPLGLKDLVEQLVVNTPADRNAPARLSASNRNRAWFSQPRPGNDATTEVITAQFKQPSVVSAIGLEALRVPCVIEVWYQDQLNNWRKVLDPQRIPLSLTVTSSTTSSWYSYHADTYSIVAKSVQIRLTRTIDPSLGAQPYVVGLRNTLIRRNVYRRHQGRLPFEDETDVMGNVISKYIKDWEPNRAIDDNATTFWRSGPQPDPEAVVNLYLDTRAADGSPQLIDKLYLDPVHTNQTLNLYYSNDDTISTPKLSPIALPPVEVNHCEWRPGRGRWSVFVSPGNSTYHFRGRWGPFVRRDCWIGCEWAADFDPADPPASNPILFEVLPSSPDPIQWWPRFYYDVVAANITLEFTNGTTTVTYTAALSPLLVIYEPIRIAVGWSYGPDTILISVMNKLGVELALLEMTPTDLPEFICLDGLVGFSNFRGTFGAHVIKLEHHSNGRHAFQANPQVYCNPEQVEPNPNGSIPTGNLDHCIYAADWTLQEHGAGGIDESWYNDKVWTPIWRDYLTAKGKIFFPGAISMKYLKLEFSNLTEEPYPVYDTNIKVRYKTFPQAVKQLTFNVTSSTQHRNPGLFGLLSMGAEILMNSIGSVNWLNPSTVMTAVNSVFGPVQQPVQVTVGAGSLSSVLPNSSQDSLNSSSRTEVSSPYVYRRSFQDPSKLAAYLVSSIVGTDGLQTLAQPLDEISGPLLNGFPVSVEVTEVPAAPVQGQDWWVFPGHTFKMPAWVMMGLTGLTQTVVARKRSFVVRIRFQTSSVHRYTEVEVVRDAAVAYFAGVREVSAMVTSYIAELDPPFWDFSRYDPSQWVLTNTRALPDGPVSTAGKVYSIPNPDFDRGVGVAPDAVGANDDWTINTGLWAWDGANDHGFHYPGAASATATGFTTNLLSAPVVAVGGDEDFVAGEQIRFHVMTFWDSLVVVNNQVGIELGLVSYLGAAVVDPLISLDTILFTDWTTHTTSGGVYVELVGEWTVPAGVDGARIRLTVTDQATAGTVRFDRVLIESVADITATVFKDLTTTSTFAKVKCDFFDSGVVRSDAMWARADPRALNIDYTALAYYVNTIVDPIPSGMWADSFAEWASAEVAWAAPRPTVAINVDPNRIFDGQRVLHIHREDGSQTAGVKIRQWTNWVSGGLFRLCARWLRPLANNNQVIVQLKRVSDGVYIYQEAVDVPASGYWYEFATHFQEIPISDDQIYFIELLCVGDDPEDMYLSDFWVEIAQVRYFMRLGGVGSFLHDVTELRYKDSAIVSTTNPVSEVSVEAVILSPKSWVYGAHLVPTYLK